MIVYVCPPLDHGWHNLQTVADYAKEIGARDAENRAKHGRASLDWCEYTCQNFLSDWETAKELASQKGWEGDFKNDPVVFFLPNETGFIPGFVIKQQNNGTTYVVTPYVLPWVERYCW